MLAASDGTLKSRPHVYCAGQITGVEGYVESAASGHVAARRLLGAAARRAVRSAAGHDRARRPAPPRHRGGAPAGYDYQPTNVVYALFPPLAERHKKQERKAACGRGPPGPRRGPRGRRPSSTDPSHGLTPANCARGIPSPFCARRATESRRARSSPPGIARRLTVARRRWRPSSSTPAGRRKSDRARGSPSAGDSIGPILTTGKRKKVGTGVSTVRGRVRLLPRYWRAGVPRRLAVPEGKGELWVARPAGDRRRCRRPRATFAWSTGGDRPGYVAPASSASAPAPGVAGCPPGCTTSPGPRTANVSAARAGAAAGGRLWLVDAGSRREKRSQSPPPISPSRRTARSPRWDRRHPRAETGR